GARVRWVGRPVSQRGARNRESLATAGSESKSPKAGARPSRSLRNASGGEAAPAGNMGGDYRHGRRRHAWNAARLAESAGPTAAALFDHFPGEPRQRGVIELLRDRPRLQRLPSLHPLSLPADVALVPDSALEHTLFFAGQRKEHVGRDGFDPEDIDVLSLQQFIYCSRCLERNPEPREQLLAGLPVGKERAARKLFLGAAQTLLASHRFGVLGLRDQARTPAMRQKSRKHGVDSEEQPVFGA